MEWWKYVYYVAIPTMSNFMNSIYINRKKQNLQYEMIKKPFYKNNVENRFLRESCSTYFDLRVNNNSGA